MRKRSRKWAVAFLTVLIVVESSVISMWLYRERLQDARERQPAIVKEADYSAAEEIEAAKQRLEENPEMPTVITDINTVDKKVALCFEGSTDSLVLEQIMEYLDAHEMTATFFISAVDAGEDQEIIDEIITAGHDIESYTLYGTPHMERMSQEELITDLCRAQVVYDDKISKRPDFLKCNATEYTDELLQTAEACGYESVVYPTQYLNYQSFATEETARNYVAGLDKGTVISIKLRGIWMRPSTRRNRRKRIRRRTKSPVWNFMSLTRKN